MSGCEKYQELISAMLDGELSEAEAADVQAHIASCDECRAMYEAFAAVSAAVSDGADMPDSLHAGIMSRVNAAAKATKKQGKLVRFQRTMAVAACFVVVVGTFFVLKKNLFNGAHETEAMDASAPMMMAAPAAGAATEAYCITEETAEEKCIAVEDEVVNAMEAPAEAAELGGIEMKSAAAPIPMPEPEEQADTAAAADEQSMIVEIRERMQNDAFIGFLVVNAETDEVFELHLSEDTEMTDEVRKALTPGCVVAVEYHTREQDERPVIYADTIHLAE